MSEIGGNRDELTCIRPKHVNQVPGSPETLDLIRGWAQTCWTEHQPCVYERRRRLSKAKLSNTMPKRLLSVGQTGMSHVTLQDDPPFLHSTTDTRYAALSYCWGDGNFCTMIENINEIRQGISLDLLPNTIRDAIRLTRVLLLPYIWIDALCIIQDDQLDKRYELPKMASIYGAADVVFSASRAHSCREGFLYPRNLSETFQTLYIFPLYDRPNGDAAGKVIVSERALADRDGDEPIDKRGWTLQEQVQALSLLKCGSRQWRWTCYVEKDGLIDGGDLYFNITTRFDSTNFDGRPSPAIFGPNAPSQDPVTLRDLWDHWRRYVTMYSARELSVRNDALPALGTMAENFATRMRGMAGRYWAGLWEYDLPGELLWFKPKASSKNAARVGPSWSWAHSAGPVHFPYIFFLSKSDSKVEILGCTVESNASGWSYGSVTRAVLTLKGHLQPLFWKGEYLCYMGRGGGSDTITLLTFWDFENGRELLDLFLLEIFQEKEAQGIILHRLENGVFERVGYYTSSGCPVDNSSLGKASVSQAGMETAPHEFILV